MSRTLAFAALAVALGVALGAAACSSTTAGPDAPSSAWRLGPMMPRPALAPGVAALGLDLVVAGGFDTGPTEGLDITARVDELDTTTDKWLPAGTLPDAPVRWTDMNLAAIGDTLYLTGGLEGVQRIAHGESFLLDPVDHLWQPITALPAGDERGAAGEVTASGRIYLLGGASTSAALATCLEFDVASRTWSHLPDLPAPRAHPAAMRRSDGTLIVAGGFATLDTSDPRGEVWELPPPGAVPRTWTPRAAMFSPGDPVNTRAGCAYGAVLGQLVCAGGARGPSAIPAVQSDDPFNAPASDAWIMAPEAMPVARTGTPGVAIGGRLFVPGGADAPASGPTTTLYIYAPLDIAVR